MNQQNKPENAKPDYRDKICKIKETCSFEGVTPAVLPLPYPKLQVRCENNEYAEILSNDFCGMVSELTAITEYINHEIRLSKEYCHIARTLLSIAQAEMIHLQMLGEVILLLGGHLNYDASTKYGPVLWTPDFVDFGTNVTNMLIADINGENRAICQYQKHIEEINDPCIKALLGRIIEDEEYHIQLLTGLLEEVNSSCNRE